MSLPWFRLYHRIIDDDKLRLLAFEDRWHFVALCCLKADGLLDAPDDSLRDRRIAVKLGVQVRELEEIGRRLQEVGLIDENLLPVAWDELQFKSDSSQERVKRYREARKERGLVAQWQPSKSLRQAVYDRDNNACVYCSATDDLSIDHKTPEMHGGTNDFANLQTACRKCNAQKRDLTDAEYRNRLSNGAVTLRKRPKTEITDTDKEDTSCETDVSLKPEHVVEIWNKTAVNLGKPKVRDITPERRQLLKARIAQYSVDDFIEVFGKVERSKFLRGDTGWRGCGFDWVFKKANFQKILEGNYDE